MGITDLNHLLQRKAPQAFQTLPLTSFRGYRIAIDGSLWAFTNFATCQKDIVMRLADPLMGVDRDALGRAVLQRMCVFLTRMITAGVTIVWVWDGTPFPEKALAKARRTKKRVSVKDRLQALRVELEAQHPLARSPDLIRQYRQVLCQQVSVRPDDIELLAAFATALGCPNVTAPYEGEKLCASLAIEGAVMGVWTTDTDAYALGVPLTITGFDGYGENGGMVKVVSLPHILHHLGMTQTEFVDLCIFLECDFNVRVPGFGEVRVARLIEQHRSLDHISTLMDLTSLNVVRCREIFAYAASDVVEATLVHSQEACRLNIISLCGHLGVEYTFLASAIRNLPAPQHVEFAA